MKNIMIAAAVLTAAAWMGIGAPSGMPIYTMPDQGTLSGANSEPAVDVPYRMALQANDWRLTGSGVRVKTVAFIDVDVYAISHYMHQMPAAKSKDAVINMDTGKKFVWTMKRDVDQEKIQTALKDAFAMNGYSDAAKIGQFVGVFKGDLKAKATVSIVYDADKKATTVNTDNGHATVAGVDFMKAVWRIWFGKIDQPKLGDQLISKMP